MIKADLTYKRTNGEWIVRYDIGLGHWPDSLDSDGNCTEKDEEPWEQWQLVLHGSEAGDQVYEKEEIDLILKNLGYRLIKVADTKN